MIAARSLPVVSLDSVLAGTTQSIADLEVKAPDDADQMRPLFERYAADLRAEAELIGSGRIDEAIAFRETGSLASGSAIHERLTSLRDASSARKANAKRKVRFMLIVPTAFGSVFVCTVFIIYDQRRKQRTAWSRRRRRASDRSSSRARTSLSWPISTARSRTRPRRPSRHSGNRQPTCAIPTWPTSSCRTTGPQLTDLILETIARDGQPSRGEVRFVVGNRVPRTMEVTAVNLIENEAVQGIVDHRARHHRAQDAARVAAASGASR